MKVTLIYMCIGVAGFNNDRPDGDREGSWIGHGIASIASSLIAGGHKVNIIDLRQLAGWDHLISILTTSYSDVYGLSVSPVDGKFVPMVAQLIKHIHPTSRVIVGGIHPSIFPDEYNLPDIDTVVIGEGEITALDLMEKIRLGIYLPKQIIGKKPDLNNIPWVARELFQYSRELTCFFAPDQKVPSITMIAGRGCPFRCTYCQPAENAVFGKPYRMRSPEDVMKELIWLRKKYDYKSITFWDDTFTLNRNWIRRFCDLYENEGIGATIAACSRADIICSDESMIKRMSEIGVDWLVIGFESGNQRVLDFLKKGTTVEQNIKASEICRKYGIKIFGTYMYGLPTETENEALDTARMIDKINPEHRSPFYFTPIPGTEIYSFCKNNDLLIGTGDKSIARTGVFSPAIKGVNYQYLGQLMSGYRGGPRNEERDPKTCQG